MEPTNTSGNLFELHIDNQSSSYLSQTAKWAKFLAIVGFIFCGLLVVYGIFAGSILRSFSDRMSSYSSTPFNSAAANIGGAFVLFFTIAFAILYFFPCLYLFRFATKMQMALGSNDQNTLTNSFGNLKSFYKFIGILTIIGLSFFALEIIFVIIFASSVIR